MNILPVFHFTVESEDSGEFKHYPQTILNKHHQTACLRMGIPDAKSFIIRATDKQNQAVGGALAWMYLRWLEVSLTALQPEARGFGLGRQMMEAVEDKAPLEGCSRARVETIEEELWRDTPFE